MSAEQTRARSFGEVADLYERRRPGYPAELYDDLLALVGPDPCALEAGAGTGRATAELGRRGVRVVAYEHDRAMAAIARGATAGLPVEIVEQPFEDWDGEPASFDLVVSAQAWHWIDKQRGPAVARRALRPGGVLAVWWNQADNQQGPLREALDEAYGRYAPELYSSVMNRPVHEVESEALASSGFEPGVEHRAYAWTQRYDARSYTDLLRTHSDHRMLPPDRLEALLSAVASAIDEVAGGELDYRYRTDLLTLRHPVRP